MIWLKCDLILCAKLTRRKKKTEKNFNQDDSTVDNFTFLLVLSFHLVNVYTLDGKKLD